MTELNVNSRSGRAPAQLRAEVAAFLDDYAVCLDEGDLERWPTYFSEDAHYRVTGWDNYEANLPHSLIYCDSRSMIVDRAVAVRQTTVHEVRRLRHFFSGLVVKEENSSIGLKSNFLIVESLSDRDPQVFLVGRSYDTLVRLDGELKFQRRLCVYDNYRILTSLIMPV